MDGINELSNRVGVLGIESVAILVGVFLLIFVEVVLFCLFLEAFHYFRIGGEVL